MEKEEIIKEVKKRFPKGTLVMSPDGNIFRVARIKWTEPKKDDWYDGIYYWGMSHDVLCAMNDNGGVGGYLYNRGEWATKLDIDSLNELSRRVRELEGGLKDLLDTKKLKDTEGKTEEYKKKRIDAWKNACKLIDMEK